jgi:hypothetical protein
MTSPTGAEDEFYDDTSDEFPSVNDLVVGAHNKIKDQVNGRLVAIWARENGVGKGQDGPYPYTDALVLVLDDGPDGTHVTDLIGPAPQELPLRFSTKGIQSRLAPRVDGMTPVKRDADGNVVAPSVPLKFRPMTGRVNARPNTTRKDGSPPIGIAKLTDEDKVILQKFKEQIIEINQRLESKATQAEDAKAFE